MTSQQRPPVTAYAYWHGALAGTPPELTAGRAEPGFYRNRRRDGTWEAVAIWRTPDGKLVVKFGAGTPICMETPEKEEDFCYRTFAWVCKNPVSQEAYNHHREHGRWPDDAPPPPVLSNLPADAFEALKMTIEAELQELLNELKRHPITTDEDATRYANWRIRFDASWKQAESLRRDEKKAHDDAAKAVQAKFLPVLGTADQGKKVISDALNRFAQDKRLKTQEAQAKMLEAAKAVGVENPEALIAAPPKTEVKTVGKKMTEVITWSAEIIDYDQALQALKDHPKLRDLVQSLADAAARSQARLPLAGVKFVSETRFR